MEYTKDQMTALFNRRLQVELDVNTHVNIKLLDGEFPPRRWEVIGRIVSLEWIGDRYGWAVGERRPEGRRVGGRHTFLYRGSDYAAAAAAFEAALLSE